MQALHDVVKAGYVRYIGMSSCWAYQCAPAMSLPPAPTNISSPLDPQSTPCRVRITELVNGSALAHYATADYAIANKLTPFISMQNHYNLIYREEEREMFPTLKVSSHRSSRFLRQCQLHTHCPLIRRCLVLGQSLGPLLREVFSADPWQRARSAWKRIGTAFLLVSLALADERV